MGAEPVAYISPNQIKALQDGSYGIVKSEPDETSTMPLYAHPPASSPHDGGGAAKPTE